MTATICMLGANCEIETLLFPKTSGCFFILHGGIHYLTYHFLIWTYTWNDLQFLEL